MTDEIQISIQLLRQVSQILLDHLELTVGDQVRLPHDYFWEIPPGELNDVYEKPSELTVGQLSDSISNLGDIAGDPSNSTSYGLVWLADVLRATGQSVVR